MKNHKTFLNQFDKTGLLAPIYISNNPKKEIFNPIPYMIRCVIKNAIPK
jgi:hypothetical protein